ncbi:Proteasome endopeptidase complex [Heracleum sosnowskyi]|uniref:Proteasome endopeptidase complex n=1 Tax=Heracleum sosnowskyi TaxID=360622 RepID=A0AAD8JK09_9APIA|nr:Proteasome endopeptidase complex [Heracleum sosnowskyi]
MIAGWDEKGPVLYYVGSEAGPTKGTRFLIGSRSPVADIVLDSWYHYDMTVEEAVELARRFMYHATFSDGVSGGTASVYYVGPDGWKNLSGNDVGKLHYQYNPVEPVVIRHDMDVVSGA